MNLFENDELNLACFDPSLVSATHGFGDVLAAAAATQSPRLETTHFLMALARLEGGITQLAFQDAQFTPAELENGLAACAVRDAQSLPPAFLTRDALDPGAGKALEDLAQLAENWQLARISEGPLLLVILQNLTPPAQQRLGRLIDLEEVIDRLVLEVGPAPEHAEVFGPADRPHEEQEVQREAFSPSGLRVLDLLVRETEALGYDQADARHFLLACLATPGSAAQLALHQQEVNPKRFQEGLMLSLRSRASRTQSSIPLARKSLQPAVQRVLEEAAVLAARERAEQIAEKHLLTAFLDTETFARRLLVDHGVNLEAAKAIVAQHEADEEPEPDPAGSREDIAGVQEALESVVFGQPEAIAQCMRYIKRMRLGYASPGKPAGVFLFCGESGTGKTELAKAMAKAVYGSEDSLLFLEMGQYQTRESMNMLVGAPHGYVGFGDGKLTNGLRNNPRQVVLFDEFEKAHREVYNAVLRFLDEGRIEDPAGPVRDGHECTIVLTSNVGAGELAQLWDAVPPGPAGLWEIRKRLRDKLLKLDFRPELLNRVDECILFRDLDDEVMRTIAEREIQKAVSWLREHLQAAVRVDEQVAPLVGAFCGNSREGARLAHRVVRSVVLDPVIDFMLAWEAEAPVTLDVWATAESDSLPPVGHVRLAADSQLGDAAATAEDES